VQQSIRSSPLAVDLLKIALDRSLREAHELGTFSLFASSAVAAANERT
jgi:hypothetical protein